MKYYINLYNKKKRVYLGKNNKYYYLKDGKRVYTTKKVLPGNETDIWFIISKTYCPYCNKAKDKLKNVKYTCVDIDVKYDNKTKKILENVKKTYNHNTVPVIFHNNKFIGGYDDLEKYLLLKK